MKTQMFTQMFLYWSGGEHSVKCVRAALEMEARKEVQRGVIRFLMAEILRRAIKSKRSGMLSDEIIVGSLGSFQTF